VPAGSVLSKQRKSLLQAGARLVSRVNLVSQVTLNETNPERFL